MSNEKHIIWSNYDLDYEDWRNDLEAEYPICPKQSALP